MDKKYKIKNSNGTITKDFFDIRKEVFINKLQEEAISCTDDYGRIFNYGLFSGKSISFLSKLYSLETFMSEFDKLSLNQEYLRLNEIRKTEMTMEEMRTYFDDLTIKFIEKSEDITPFDEDNWEIESFETNK